MFLLDDHIRDDSYIIYDVPKHVLVASICNFLSSCYIVLQSPPGKGFNSHWDMPATVTHVRWNTSLMTV